MFSDANSLVKRETIDGTVEPLRSRYGNRIIRSAVLLTSSKMPHEDVLKRAILQKEGV